jgi:hypothetical protein
VRRDHPSGAISRSRQSRSGLGQHNEPRCGVRRPSKSHVVHVSRSATSPSIPRTKVQLGPILPIGKRRSRISSKAAGR